MSGWNMTGDKLPNEEKANKAISDVQFKTSPFNGGVAGWQEDEKEKEKERIAVKGIEDAYKKDYARFKQENPGVDPASVSKIFEAIMEEEKQEQGRAGGMRR